MNSHNLLSLQDINHSLNNRDLINFNLTQKSKSTMWISKVIIWIIKAVGLGKNYHLTNVVSAVCNKVVQLSGEELNQSNLTDAYSLLNTLKGRVESCCKKCKATGSKATYTQAAQTLFQTQSRVLEELVRIKDSQKPQLAVDLVPEALERNGQLLENPSNSERSDKLLVEKAVQSDPESFESASLELQEDQNAIIKDSQKPQLPVDLVPEALERNGLLLENLSSSERSNKLLVEKAVQSNPESFQYASAELQRDQNFILHLLKGVPQLIKHLNSELQNDSDFLCEACSLNPACLNYTDKATGEYARFLITEQRLSGFNSVKQQRIQFENLLRKKSEFESLDPIQHKFDSLDESQIPEARKILQAIKLNPFATYRASSDLLSNSQFLLLAANLGAHISSEHIPSQLLKSQWFQRAFSRAQSAAPLSVCQGLCASERVTAPNLPEEFWVSRYPPQLHSYWEDICQYGYNIGVQLQHDSCKNYHLSKGQKGTFKTATGQFTVKLSREQKLEVGVSHRIYEITDSNNHRRLFNHLFINWPDFGVPNPKSFAAFNQVYNKLVDSKVDSKCTTTPPKVHVHCRAGHGRSGTLLLSRIYSLNLQADPYALLLDLRKYRRGLVETPVQFQFATNRSI